MKTHDWLYNYRHIDGIEKSFGGLARRATYLTETAIAFDIFKVNYEAMRRCYAAFFPSLKNFATHQFQQLLNS